MNVRAGAVLDPNELRDRLISDTSPQLLDVRTPGEFETSHIAGAYKRAA
jgi:rhodanese-related sulfurtransferase